MSDGAEAQGGDGRRRIPLARLVARDWLTFPAVFLVGVALAAVSTILRGFPPPLVPDELSYLLGADTFLHGRLANPTHPVWQHFETFHVLQHPSYASKFPPAQALVLAFGTLITGHAIVGVWLSFGLVCAALLWMLRAWTTRRWALAVSLGVACALAPSYWAYSYWGGAVPAAAAALTFGAVRRIVDADDGPLAGLAIVLGVGVLVLANSRPYEGLLAALPVACVLGWWLFRGTREQRRQYLMHCVLPLAALLAAGAALMLTYNRAVTGGWFELPYLAYQRQYDPVSLFRFLPDHQRLLPPNAVFRSFVALEHAAVPPFSATWYLRRCFYIVARSFQVLHVPAILLLVFAALPFAARMPWNRFAAGVLVWGTLGVALTTWFEPHYAAPFLPVCAAIWAECLRRVGGLRVRRWSVGIGLAGAAVALLAGNGLALVARGREAPSYPAPLMAPRWVLARLELASSLARSGRKHLVVVSYAPDHTPHAEWVYNAADIDAAPVVWARDLGDNDRLLRYFRSRQLWSLRVVTDSGPFVLRPLAPPQSASARPSHRETGRTPKLAAPAS